MKAKVLEIGFKAWAIGTAGRRASSSSEDSEAQIGSPRRLGLFLWVGVSRKKNSN